MLLIPQKAPAGDSSAESKIKFSAPPVAEQVPVHGGFRLGG